MNRSELWFYEWVHSYICWMGYWIMVCLRSGSSTKARLAMSQVQFPHLYVMFCTTSRLCIIIRGSLFPWIRIVNQNNFSLQCISSVKYFFFSDRKRPLDMQVSILPGTIGWALFLTSSRFEAASQGISYPYKDITSDWGLLLTSDLCKDPFTTENHLHRKSHRLRSQNIFTIFFFSFSLSLKRLEW